MRELEIPMSGKCRIYVNGEWRTYVRYMRFGKLCRRLWVKPREPRTPGQSRGA